MHQLYCIWLNLTKTNNMDEIIISDKGNTYIGNIAQNAIKTPIPPIFKIDGTENYHVFEWQYGRWILRASQSAMALASEIFPAGR